MSERAGHDVVPLRTAVGIFESLEMRGVRHCHWKSNQHLGAALAGMTDIDLLVDRKQAAICKDVLLQVGCRPFSSQVWVTYPGIEDWLGCDSDTGELFHVHLHFQLLTGKRHVKEWHLPLEEVVLQTCVRHHAYGIAVTDPSLELVLLAIRLYVKTPVPHRSWGPLGGRAVADDMRAEIEYLYRQSNVRDIRRFCSLVFGERDGTEVSTLIEGGELHRKRNIARLSGPVKRRFSPHRRYKYGRRVARLTTSNAAFVLSDLPAGSTLMFARESE